MVIHTRYIQVRLRSPEPRVLQILVHSFIGQPRYLTSSLATGGSHTVPVSSNIHPPSASAKQAYWPPVWLFGVHSVSRFVNLSVGAFSRGLPLILLFNPNFESFGHNLGRYAQSSSLGSCFDCLSR